MSEFDPAAISREQLFSPPVDAATLAQVAAARPDLWNDILHHPNLYPGLRDWITQQMPPSANAPGSDQPMRQMTDGARQVTTGAKDFFSSTVGPAAASAAQSVRGAVADPSGSTGKLSMTQSWPAFAAGGAAVLALISLFLPAGSLFGQFSVNLVNRGVSGTGWLVFPLLVLVFAAVTFALLMRTAKTLLILLAAAALAGAVGIAVSIMVMTNITGYPDSSVGAGSVLLLIMSVILLATGVVGFLLRNARPAAGAAGQNPGAGFGPDGYPQSPFSPQQ